MKYAKMLGLMATAAVALMACVGTASADIFTSPPGAAYTGNLKATSANLTWHNATGTIACHSNLEGPITGHGAGKHVTVTVTALNFNNCVGGTAHNATILGGTLTLDVTGTNHGTLRSTGASFTTTMFGVECGYTTNNTPIGTVTVVGEHAVLDISTSLPRTHGSFFCGNTGNWTGTYTFTTPTKVHLDV